jgi:hypothetical protein
LQQTVEQLLNQFIGADQWIGGGTIFDAKLQAEGTMTMATATPPMEMDGLS